MGYYPRSGFWGNFQGESLSNTKRLLVPSTDLRGYLLLADTASPPHRDPFSEEEIGYGRSRLTNSMLDTLTPSAGHH